VGNGSVGSGWEAASVVGSEVVGSEVAGGEVGGMLVGASVGNPEAIAGGTSVSVDSSSLEAGPPHAARAIRIKKLKNITSGILKEDARRLYMACIARSFPGHRNSAQYNKDNNVDESSQMKIWSNEFGHPFG
jgi:hypothetical protein